MKNSPENNPNQKYHQDLQGDSQNREINRYSPSYINLEAPSWKFLLGVGGVGILTALVLAHQVNKEQTEQYIHPQGAHEEFTPASMKFSIVYEGQQQPGCFGDIQKVAPIINRDGKITGVNVICKSDAAEPTK